MDLNRRQFTISATSLFLNPDLGIGGRVLSTVLDTTPRLLPQAPGIMNSNLYSALSHSKPKSLARFYQKMVDFYSEVGVPFHDYTEEKTLENIPSFVKFISDSEVERQLPEIQKYFSSLPDPLQTILQKPEVGTLEMNVDKNIIKSLMGYTPSESSFQFEGIIETDDFSLRCSMNPSTGCNYGGINFRPEKGNTDYDLVYESYNLTIEEIGEVMNSPVGNIVQLLKDKVFKNPWGEDIDTDQIQQKHQELRRNKTETPFEKFLLSTTSLTPITEYTKTTVESLVSQGVSQQEILTVSKNIDLL